jgi:hypothetical protein
MNDTRANVTESDLAELDRQYGFGPVNDDKKARMSAIRADFREIALSVLASTPPSRARSLALTNLQQAKMWAVQAIVDEVG